LCDGGGKAHSQGMIAKKENDDRAELNTVGFSWFLASGSFGVAYFVLSKLEICLRGQRQWSGLCVCPFQLEIDFSPDDLTG
jgi:hypothetical protein